MTVLPFPEPKALGFAGGIEIGSSGHPALSAKTQARLSFLYIIIILLLKILILLLGGCRSGGPTFHKLLFKYG